MAIRSRGVRACRLGEAFDIQRAAVVVRARHTGIPADVAAPDSAHGFLFQHRAEYAADVEAFLAEPI
jgi:hypothetical protein